MTHVARLLFFSFYFCWDMTFDNNIPTKFPSLDENAPSGSDLLSLERCKASFEVQKLTEFMYTKAWLEKRDRVLAVIERDPGFSKDHRYYQSRDARLKSGYNKDKRIIELAKEHQWGPEERRVATFLYDQSTPVRTMSHTHPLLTIHPFVLVLLASRYVYPHIDESDDWWAKEAVPGTCIKVWDPRLLCSNWGRAQTRYFKPRPLFCNLMGVEIL